MEQLHFVIVGTPFVDRTPTLWTRFSRSAQRNQFTDKVKNEYVAKHHTVLKEIVSLPLRS